LQYDAEGRLVGENNGLATYAYDGEGRRVMKTVGTQTTVYVYDAAGNLAAEYGSTAAAGTQYLTADHLGSTRLVTGAGGAVLERHDYTPFGEDLCTENGRNAIAEYTAGCANTAPPSGVHRQGTRCRIWARLL
jgi:YD repeat-containing protein